MKECKNFVFRFIGTVILMISINIIGFNIFQQKVIYKIVKDKNEKNLNKSINILDRYIYERKSEFILKSESIIKNIKKRLKDVNITEEDIVNSVVEESSLNANYYIEVFNQSEKLIANSPGYIEKILKSRNSKKENRCEIVSAENNIYIKSLFKFGNNGEEKYTAIVSYKLNEDFFDRVKEYLVGEVNVYNKNKDILLTTVKGLRQEKIKKKSVEVKNYNNQAIQMYTNKEQSGILKTDGDVLYEVIMPIYTEKQEMKKYFFYIILYEIGFLIIIIIILLRFMKQITGTEKDFWKKMRLCMLGKDEGNKVKDSDSFDYNTAFYTGKDIFIKNIYDSLNCIEKREDIKEKIHKLKDLTEIYNSCFVNIKDYKVEDVEVIQTVKTVAEICSKYNIIVEIRKNRSKMYSGFEINSMKYIFISIIYKLSEMYNSIKINVTVEDYGRKIFIRFKSEETGIVIADKICLESMFNKEFIDYLIMINNMGYAEKNGVVEISMNV